MKEPRQVFHTAGIACAKALCFIPGTVLPVQGVMGGVMQDRAAELSWGWKNGFWAALTPRPPLYLAHSYSSFRPQLGVSSSEGLDCPVHTE